MSRRSLVLAVLALPPAVAGCGDLVGLGGTPTPLARIQVDVTGDLGPLRPPGTESETPHLRVALIWGTQWLAEPLCFLPPESPEAETVIQAGCRDPFGFAPDRVAANVAVEIGVPATMELFDLPGADVMVGDVTARVAYGTLVVYDDRDGSGTLELRRPKREDFGPPNMDGGPPPPIDDPRDIIYGASFVSMTMPDRRLAFREGGFNAGAAFYPRSGCEAPPPGFSVLAAGGFSADDALAAALQGMLPAEDPAMCGTAALDATVVTIALEPPAGVREVACRVRRTDGSVRYRDPSEAPMLDGLVWGCVHYPNLGGDTPVDGLQLVIAAPAADACMGLTHYSLRGCEEDPGCETPQWDRTTTVPDWWPCPVASPSP